MKNKILILSGPTYEYIDPVRFLGNASSGLMGKSLIEEAYKNKISVDFITGPISNNNIPKINPSSSIHHVTSADEMNEKALELFNKHKVAICAAAVADYRPEKKLDKKLTSNQENFYINLIPTPDIALNLGKIKSNQQITIGFSLQDNDNIETAFSKLKRKKLDLIILNHPSSIGSSYGKYYFISTKGNVILKTKKISKKDCSMIIFDFLNDKIRKD